jgi:hypothetical protein
VIEKIAMSANKKIAAFDIDSELLHYRDSINVCVGFPPPILEQKVKFKTPKIDLK